MIYIEVTENKVRHNVSAGEDNEVDRLIASSIELVKHNKISCKVYMFRKGKKSLLMKSIYRNWKGKVIVK